MIDRPTPPTNPRYLLFANELLKGSSQVDAYRTAGFKARSAAAAKVGATKLRKHPEVAAYLKACRQQAANQAALTLAEKRAFLARIVRVPITAIDPDKQANADLIKRYTTHDTAVGTTTSIEKHDPLKAIEIDNKLSGEDPTTASLQAVAEALGRLGGGVLPQGSL